MRVFDGRRISVASLVAAVVLAACGGSSGSGSTTVGVPYKVAFIGALSGPTASIGQGDLDGFQTFINYLNAHGGVNGRKVDISIEDNQNNSAQSASAIRAVAAQGAVAIFGLSQAKDLAAAIPTLNEVGISDFSGGTSPSTIMPPTKWVFGSDMPGAAEAPPELAFAKTITGKQTPTIALSPNDTPAQLEWAAVIKQLAVNQGMSVLQQASVPVAAADVTSQAQRLIAGNPDIIISHIYGDPFILLDQKLRQLGYKNPVLDYHAAVANGPLEQMNDQNAYVDRTSRSLNDKGGSGFNRFVSAVKENHKEDSANSAILFADGYQMGLIMEAGLKHCGTSCTAATFNTAISNITIDNGFTWAPIAFNPNRHQAIDSVAWYHAVNGKSTPAANSRVYTGLLTPNGPVGQ